ncbi:MAG: LysR family transcriptional regulator [Cyanobacteria bacterium J06638_7]
MIQVHQLRALEAIARHPSLTAAARSLHCTQSGLSHLLRDLERQLQIRLVDRDRRPPALTAAGRRLLRCAAVVLPEIEAAQDDLQRMVIGAAGRLFISLECHSCIDWLLPAMLSFRDGHGEVELDVRIGAQFDPLPGLLDGSVDLVISGERNSGRGVLADPLFRYQIVAVVPRRHPLAAKACLCPEDFGPETIITYPVAECRLDLYSRFLEPAGVIPQRRRTAEMTAMIVQWVALGLGVAALPSWAVPSSAAVVCLPLGEAGLWADLQALRRRSDQNLAHLDAFVNVARDQVFRQFSDITPITPRSTPPQGSAPT